MTSVPTMLDVVVLTWNDGALLDTAVRSALDSSGVEIRVFVIDNGSDEAPDLSADGRITTVVNAANRGVAAGRNQGAALGTSPFICFLDSDACLRPETLRQLVEPLVTDPNVALAVPVFSDQAPEASAGRAPSLVDKALRVVNIRDAYRPVSQVGQWWDVDFGIGACQVVRRSDFMNAGGFDESYFYGPEDVDFCLRLREGGRRIVQVGSADCEHPARRRFRGLMTQRGLQHAWAVARHLWRHRRFHRRVSTA